MDVQAVRADALSAEDLKAWRSFCAATPDFASPFLAPSFALAVAAVRPDVWVAIGRDRAGPAGFFAFHRRPGGYLRPVGAPVSDAQGVVMRPGAPADLAAIVAGGGGDVARFSALAGFADDAPIAAAQRRNAWVIDLADGAEAYLARLRQGEAKHLANTQRCARKAERELGPVRFSFHDASAQTWDTLIAWKRARFRETGKHDIFSAGWIQALFQRLRTWPDPNFGLVVASVRFGARLAAAEIYLRKADRLHAWISGFDRDLSIYAPGHILTARMIEAASAEGVRRIDFGIGSDEYKAKWCLTVEPLWEAVVHANTPLGQTRAAGYSGWRAASQRLGPANTLLSKARGRTDHVFAAHANWIDAGAALAASALVRR